MRKRGRCARFRTLPRPTRVIKMSDQELMPSIWDSVKADIPPFDPVCAQKIAALIGMGLPASKICRLPQFPNMVTHYQWLSVFPEYAEMIRQAREDQADTHADRIIEIAYETLAGAYKPEAARVAIDALKWIASKLKARVYGERVEHRVISALSADEMSDAELARIAKAGAMPRLTTTYRDRDSRAPEDMDEAFTGPDGVDWKLNALEKVAEWEEAKEIIESGKVYPDEQKETGAARPDNAGDNDDDWLR